MTQRQSKLVSHLLLRHARLLAGFFQVLPHLYPPLYKIFPIHFPHKGPACVSCFPVLCPAAGHTMAVACWIILVSMPDIMLDVIVTVLTVLCLVSQMLWSSATCLFTLSAFLRSRVFSWYRRLLSIFPTYPLPSFAFFLYGIHVRHHVPKIKQGGNKNDYVK